MRGVPGALVKVEEGAMEGSLLTSTVHHLRHQRALWQGGREPDASSEERGPIPAPHPAQPPPHTSDHNDL